MNIVFLHGLESKPGGSKPTTLIAAGHDVQEPLLPANDFELSVEVAQSLVDEHVPDVIVGSSRGGAVAMSVDPKGARLVLVAPAGNIYNTSARVASNTVILHSMKDAIVPFEDSSVLSNLNGARLIDVGEDHRMNDKEALYAILEAVEGTL